MNYPKIVSFIILSVVLHVAGQEQAAWVPDMGDGTFKNPVIFADYSDPDIIKADDNFYMTASSFNCVPGLPILHSKDLVNWRIINHAIPRFDDPAFDVPQHGNGVWAPSFRFHEGWFYIYWGDPDRGIFMVKTQDPYGQWTKPYLVKKAYGNIDPSPLWDDDGKVYMVHAFAHSRAGVKSLLQVNELNTQGTEILDKGQIVFDGHDSYPTIEGPKFYKRNGYYYIFAPAGGVPTGWQTILRSKNIYGPYEDKIVLEQGSTAINGPHQGGWLSLASAEDWFMHFQDRDAYGRIVHLNPVNWVNDWPLMGKDYDGNGVGEPVSRYKKPDVGKKYLVKVPQTSDDFNNEKLGLQWQWQANYKADWYSLTAKPGYLRLYPVHYNPQLPNKWLMPNMLLQKFPAEKFTVTTKLTLNFKSNQKTALIVMGRDYAFIQVENSAEKIKISQVACYDAENSAKEKLLETVMQNAKDIYLRVNVSKNAQCDFSYSTDGKTFLKVGSTFKAREGKWIGAKVGLLAFDTSENSGESFVDYDWFKIQ